MPNAPYYRPGDKPVPGYQLIERVGEGMIGDVWKALGPGRIVQVLKICSLHEKAGEKELRALQQMKWVKHPNLVPVSAFWLVDKTGTILDDGTDDSESIPHETVKSASTLIMAMGLCEESLSDRLHECQKEGMEGIPFDELIEYMHSAGEAIDFLNAQRIQHCDVKPHNILLVGGAVQVCDFGLAKVIGDDVRRTGQTFLSAAYGSPELARGTAGPMTDQYSLAITYVELRTGRLPYANEEWQAVMAAKARGTLDFSMLAPNEAEVIGRATALNPDDRYPSCRQMVRALRAAFTADRTSSVRISASRGPSIGATAVRPTRPAARSDTAAKITAGLKTATKILVVAALAIAVGIVAAIFFRPNIPDRVFLTAAEEAIAEAQRVLDDPPVGDDGRFDFSRANAQFDEAIKGLDQIPGASDDKARLEQAVQAGLESLKTLETAASSIAHVEEVAADPDSTNDQLQGADASLRATLAGLDKIPSDTKAKGELHAAALAGLKSLSDERVQRAGRAIIQAESILKSPPDSVALPDVSRAKNAFDEAIALLSGEKEQEALQGEAGVGLLRILARRGQWTDVKEGLDKLLAARKLDAFSPAQRAHIEVMSVLSGQRSGAAEPGGDARRKALLQQQAAHLDPWEKQQLAVSSGPVPRMGQAILAEAEAAIGKAQSLLRAADADKGRPDLAQAKARFNEALDLLVKAGDGDAKDRLKQTAQVGLETIDDLERADLSIARAQSILKNPAAGNAELSRAETEFEGALKQLAEVAGDNPLKDRLARTAQEALAGMSALRLTGAEKAVAQALGILGDKESSTVPYELAKAKLMLDEATALLGKLAGAGPREEGLRKQSQLGLLRVAARRAETRADWEQLDKGLTDFQKGQPSLSPDQQAHLDVLKLLTTAKLGTLPSNNYYWTTAATIGSRYGPQLDPWEQTVLKPQSTPAAGPLELAEKAVAEAVAMLQDPPVSDERLDFSPLTASLEKAIGHLVDVADSPRKKKSEAAVNSCYEAIAAMKDTESAITDARTVLADASARSDAWDKAESALQQALERLRKMPEASRAKDRLSQQGDAVLKSLPEKRTAHAEELLAEAQRALGAASASSTAFDLPRAERQLTDAIAFLAKGTAEPTSRKGAVELEARLGLLRVAARRAKLPEQWAAVDKALKEPGNGFETLPEGQQPHAAALRLLSSDQLGSPAVASAADQYQNALGKIALARLDPWETEQIGLLTRKVNGLIGVEKILTQAQQTVAYAEKTLASTAASKKELGEARSRLDGARLALAGVADPRKDPLAAKVRDYLLEIDRRHAKAARATMEAAEKLLVEAAPDDKQLDQAKEKFAEAAGLLDDPSAKGQAALGLLRVSARRTGDQNRWAAVDKGLKSLAPETLPAEEQTHYETLRLLADAALGESPVQSAPYRYLDRVQRLQSTSGLDPWEQRQLEALGTRVIEVIGVDVVLKKAGETIASAEALLSDPAADSGKLDEVSRRLNDALAELAKVKDPRKDPWQMKAQQDLAKIPQERLTRAKAALADAQKSLADPASSNALPDVARAKIRFDEAASLLAGVDEAARSGLDGEARLGLLRIAARRSQWSEVDRGLQQIKGSSALPAGQQPHYEALRLVTDVEQGPSSDLRLPQLAALEKLRAQLDPWEQQKVDLLKEGVARAVETDLRAFSPDELTAVAQILPNAEASLLKVVKTRLGLATNYRFVLAPPSDDQLEKAAGYLAAADRLTQARKAAPSTELRTLTAMVSFGRKEWPRALALSTELLADPAVKSDQGLQTQLRLVRAYALSHTESGDLAQAIKDFYDVMATVFSKDKQETGAGTAFSDLQVYETVVSPALELAERFAGSSGQMPSELKASLAALYAAKGTLIRRDLEVEKRVGQAAQAPGPASRGDEAAYEAFQKAARLNPQPEYLVEQGRVLIDLPRDDEAKKLEELDQLTTRALGMPGGDQYPDAHGLEGYVSVIQSRTVADPAKEVGLLNQAVASYNKALELCKQSGRNPPPGHYLTGLSAAYLVLAFHAQNTKSEFEKYLGLSASRAEEATRIPDRSQPDNAWIAWGNALEDMAFYLDRVDKYADAIDKFSTGVTEAAENGRLTAPALFNRGRCRLRQAQYGRLDAKAQGERLGEALTDLQTAMGVWERAEDWAGAAEPCVWISQVYLAKADRATDARDRSTLQAQADEACGKGVQYAGKVKSLYWPQFQLVWAQLAVARADSVEAARRAEDLLAASTSAASYEVRDELLAQAIDVIVQAGKTSDERVQKLDAALARFPAADAKNHRCRALLLLRRSEGILGEKDNAWKRYESRCRQDAEEVVRLADSMASGSSARFAANTLKARGLTVLGRLGCRLYYDKNDPAQASEAAKNLVEAAPLFGSDVRASVLARTSFAALSWALVQGTQDPKRVTEWATLALQTLEPINREHVGQKDWEIIEEYRKNLRAKLSSVGAVSPPASR